MSTFGSPPPSAGAAVTTEDQWKVWALAVFGGNEARATAAARAAAAARTAGASSDDIFAAARAAYDTVSSPSRTDVTSAADGTTTTDCVVRPSGRSVLGVSLVGILISGIGTAIVTSGKASLVPVVVAAAVIMGVWFALSLRSSVTMSGPTVYVQGVLHRRQFPRLDVRQITVQPRARQLGVANGPLRGQFLASFVRDDFTHLFELRQGGWTRTDIDRIGSAIGVQVINDQMTSIT